MDITVISYNAELSKININLKRFPALPYQIFLDVKCRKLTLKCVNVAPPAFFSACLLFFFVTG